jgi:N-acetylneuraminic acid mutarotase
MKTLSCTALPIKEFLARKSIIVLEHVITCGSFLFPPMKNNFKRSYFEAMEGIQKVMMAFLNKFQENDFWKRFDSYRHWWN